MFHRHIMQCIIISALALSILPAERLSHRDENLTGPALTIYNFNATLSPIPDSVTVISLPETDVVPFTSIWDNLPLPVHSVKPIPLKAGGRGYGFILYSTRLPEYKSGKLTVIDIHDYATVFLDGKYTGTLDRRLGINTIELPRTDTSDPLLEVFVEGAGKKKCSLARTDRKGITDRVILNGQTLMNWDIYSFQMDEAFISGLKASDSISDKPGTFFKGSFTLETVAGTFIDMTNFIKGVVWVNGKALGRYWETEPRQRLWCPASLLKKGNNEIIIFDLHKTEPGTIRGFETLNQ